MAKKVLIVILLVFYCLIGETGNKASAEAALKGECSVQIKNLSVQAIDI